MTSTYLNEVLRDGGMIVISRADEYSRYSKRDAGCFTTGDDGDVYVRNGKAKIRLTLNRGKLLLAKIDVRERPKSDYDVARSEMDQQRAHQRW
jgi:hypothetical protein